MKLVSGVTLVLGLVGVVTSSYFLVGAVELGMTALSVIGLLISLWFTAASLMAIELFKILK